MYESTFITPYLNLFGEYSLMVGLVGIISLFCLAFFSTALVGYYKKLLQPFTFVLWALLFVFIFVFFDIKNYVFDHAENSWTCESTNKVKGVIIDVNASILSFTMTPGYGWPSNTDVMAVLTKSSCEDANLQLEKLQ